MENTRLVNSINGGSGGIQIIGVARGGHGRAFALPSLNFALPSKPSSYLNSVYTDY